MTILLICLAFVLIYVTYWYFQRRKMMSIFKNYGIPGPEPNLIWGNLLEMDNKGIVEVFKEWSQKHGKVFGYYLGCRPMLVIADAALCKEIQIKDFSSFTDRPFLIPGGAIPDERFVNHIINVNGNKWKEHRALLTPAFTTGKMKQMFSLVDKSIDTMLERFNENAKTETTFDIYEKFKGLTLDVIAKTAFGVETDVQKNPKDPFLLGAQDVVKENVFSGLIFLAVCFPEFDFILRPLRSLVDYIKLYTGIDRVKLFHATCAKLVTQRRNNPNLRRSDMLQSMIDAEMTKDDIKKVSGEKLTAGAEMDTEDDSEITKDNQPGKHVIKRAAVSLTDYEVMANTFIMLFAGYETTSTALAYTSHILVNNPDIQEKMRKEIKAVIAEEGELNYTCISKLKYMDQIWSETLRYYAPVPSFVNRVCTAEKKYGDLTIPNGVTVQVSVPLLHRDPDYWNDPNTFDSERFSTDRRSEIIPMAYQPFGAGPRNCIGMRFAQLEAKLALARLLNEYRIVPSAKTETGDLSVTIKFVIMAPKKGVFVKVEKI